MELKMFIGNVFIEGVPINITKLNSPGYINHLRSELEEKNEDLLDLSDEKPHFFIDTLPSGVKLFPKKRYRH